VHRVAPAVHREVAEAAQVARAVRRGQEVARLTRAAVVRLRSAERTARIALLAQARSCVDEVVPAALRTAAVAFQRLQSELALSAVAGDVRASDAVFCTWHAFAVCSQVHAWSVALGALLREEVEVVVRHAREAVRGVHRAGLAAFRAPVAVDLVSHEAAFFARTAVVVSVGQDVEVEAAGAVVRFEGAAMAHLAAPPAPAVCGVHEVPRGRRAVAAAVLVFQQVEAGQAAGAPAGLVAGLAVGVAQQTLLLAWRSSEAVGTGVHADRAAPQEVLALSTARADCG